MESIEQIGERILEYSIIAGDSGEIGLSSMGYKQNDFIPWKRRVSF